MSRQRPFLSCFFTAAIVLLSVASVGAEELREEFREFYDLGPGETLSVQNTNGSLDIAKWNESRVLVEATKTVEALGRSRAEEAMNALRIEIDHHHGRLEIRTELPKNSEGVMSWLFGRRVRARVAYRIRVPSGVDVQATTVNGNVTVEAVDGQVSAKTTNGQIRISGAGAGTSASTTNGSIRAEFRELAGIGGIDLRTTNGGITVYAPADVQCSLRASTVNGAVSTDFAISGVHSRSRKRLHGDINGGGRELSLKTVNGSIQLRKKSSSR